MDYNERLIEAVTNAMKRRKITGKMIEENTGVTPSTISMWKKGNRPTFDNAVKVMQYLQIGMADILDIVGKSELEMKHLIAGNYAIEIRDSYKRSHETIVEIVNNETLTFLNKLQMIRSKSYEQLTLIDNFYSDAKLITGQEVDQFIPEGFSDFTDKDDGVDNE